MNIKDFVLGYVIGKNDGGGGSSVTVESLTVATNDTYTAPAGKAYSPVVVNVPNSYSASAERKVVSNGALVSQTAHAKVTENGTIDTTLNNSVEVDVSASGGGNCATGTITFEAEQSIIPSAANKVSVNHNLGRAPIGVAWMIDSTDDTNIGGDQFNPYVQGAYLIVGEYITAEQYFAANQSTSNVATIKQYWKMWNGATGASSLFASLNGNSSTVDIFINNANRPSGTIPANTTIRWFVW